MKAKQEVAHIFHYFVKSIYVLFINNRNLLSNTPYAVFFYSILKYYERCYDFCMNEFLLPQQMSTILPFFLPFFADGDDKSSPFINRIRKNYRHVRKWAKRTHTDCFRIYDRDIKEYPVAIDFYAGHFLVQYFSYNHETDEIPRDLVQEVEGAIVSIFQASADSIFARTRIRRKMTEQYEKIAEEKEFFCVHEYGVKFKVNLHDYLDTGLFLDHRETRQFIAKQASNKRVLNLFAYTCSFSVHAAIKGAKYTKSVDLSNTYTAWA